MNIAPMPVLGLEVDPAIEPQQRRLHTIARRAAWLAAISVLLTIMLVFSWMTLQFNVFYFPKQYHIGIDTRVLFLVLRLVCGSLLLTTLGLGICTWRTRAGKTAVSLSLFLPLLVLLTFLFNVQQGNYR